MTRAAGPRVTMDCYICGLRDERAAAAGVCRLCGAALCGKHLWQAQGFAVGGMGVLRVPIRSRAGEPDEQAVALIEAIKRRLVRWR